MATAVALAGASAGAAVAATAGPSSPSGNAGTQVSAASARESPSGRTGPSGHPSRRSLRQSARPATSPRTRRQAAVVHEAKPARQATRRHTAALARNARPYLVYDSVIPSTIPGNPVVATYANGGHPVSPSEVAGRRTVLWIDIEGNDPQAQVLDIEPGCATPSMAPTWVRQRLTDQPGGVAILYTMLSEWPAVQQAVATLPSPLRSRVRWWIANPTGSPHIVPGSDATQWYWGSNYDISSATPRFQRG